MDTTLLLRYWKQLVVIIAIVGSCAAGYNIIYERGYNAAQTEYIHKIEEYNKEIDKKVSNIEELSTMLAQDTVKSNDKLNKDLAAILLSINGKPLVNCKDGKATMAQEFLDSYNSLILKGNSK